MKHRACYYCSYCFVMRDSSFDRRSPCYLYSSRAGAWRTKINFSALHHRSASQSLLTLWLTFKHQTIAKTRKLILSLRMSCRTHCAPDRCVGPLFTPEHAGWRGLLPAAAAVASLCRPTRLTFGYFSGLCDGTSCRAACCAAIVLSASVMQLTAACVPVRDPQMCVAG